MAYKPDSTSVATLKQITEKGKANALTPPWHKPLFETPVTILALLCIPLAGVAFYFWNVFAAAAVLGAGALIYGIRELFIQDDHAIVRIYGPLGRLRYFFERELRDKYLQYFNETNTSGRPIPRIVRDYIYQKSKGIKAYSSFGTELDLNDSETTTGARVLHRNFTGYRTSASYLVEVGAKRKDVKPFLIKNTINVSAMSYGSINQKAAESLSIGAKGIAYVNTGEGGYGPHGVAGNDVVFQIGTGKFGVGEKATLQDGTPTRVLNMGLLKQLVRDNPNIGMIQLKISQGAKPGLGGHLPAEKVTPEIAHVRRIEPYHSVISPSQHAEILAKSPKETILKLIEFIEWIRKETELPVSLKMCVGRLDEVDLLCDAMKSLKKGPDNIQIDGSDGGTGAAPNLFLNYVGYGGAIESAYYLHTRLKKLKLRDRVSINVSGRIFTPVHAALAFASGADVVDTARGAMLALGCIQSLRCHTNACPTGIATNNPWRMRGLAIPEKSTRVHHFLTGFHSDMLKITEVTGHSDPRDISFDDLRILDPSVSGYFED